MKLTYAVVIEQTPNNYGAYAPDVPGCVSTGKTWDEMLAMSPRGTRLPYRGDAEGRRTAPRA